jgi:hypothetical protein
MLLKNRPSSPTARAISSSFSSAVVAFSALVTCVSIIPRTRIRGSRVDVLDHFQDGCRDAMIQEGQGQTKGRGDYGNADHDKNRCPHLWSPKICWLLIATSVRIRTIDCHRENSERPKLGHLNPLVPLSAPLVEVHCGAHRFAEETAFRFLSTRDGAIAQHARLAPGTPRLRPQGGQCNLRPHVAGAKALAPYRSHVCCFARQHQPLCSGAEGSSDRLCRAHERVLSESLSFRCDTDFSRREAFPA